MSSNQLLKLVFFHDQRMEELAVQVQTLLRSIAMYFRYLPNLIRPIQGCFLWEVILQTIVTESIY